jgi:hypothetical protein
MAGETGSGILDPTNLSFAFGAGTGTPSYMELDRRRAIAQALAQQKRGFPKNIGEGLTAIGEAVGDRFADARLTQQERAGAAAEAAKLAAARGAPGVGAASPSTTAPIRGATPPVPGPTAVPASPAVPATPLTPAVPKVPSPTADVTNPTDALKDRLTAMFVGGGQGGTGGAAPNPTEAAETPPQASPTTDTSAPALSVASFPEATASGDDGWTARQDAIGGIESGGRKDPYRTVGVMTKYGRALGRYGVMESNVPKWTAAVFGEPMTPAQFLANDQAQDAVFRNRFGSYVAQFGEEGAARAWFGGPGNINKVDLTDAHERLSIGDYGKDYLRRLRSAAGGGPASGSTPQPGPTPASFSAGVASADQGQGQAIDDTGPPNIETHDPTTGATTTNLNPPTPTTITPMPRTGTRVTSDTAPSVTPIPPASEQRMEPPGAKPTPPERVDFSPRQRAMAEIMRSPYVSPQTREAAKLEYEQEEKVRTELTARREADYTYERGRHDKYTDEYNKFIREAPDRVIKQLGDRIAIEKEQHNLTVMAPLEAALKAAELRRQPDVAEKLKMEIKNAQADLDKKLYEVTQRAMEERKLAAETTHAEQVAAAGVAPPHYNAEGQLVTWNQKEGQWQVTEPKPLPSAGGPPNVGPLTGEQSKDLALHDKARIALDQMARIPDGEKILAEGLKQELLGRVPYFGNALLESRYRSMRNAADSLVQAHLRQLSGAAYSAQELTSTHNNLIPVYGDDARVMQQKAEQRNSVAQGLYLGLGKARPLADYAIAERSKADKAAQEKIAAEMPPNPEVGRIYEKTDPKTKRVIKRHWTGTRWEQD